MLPILARAATMAGRASKAIKASSAVTKMKSVGKAIGGKARSLFKKSKSIGVNFDSDSSDDIQETVESSTSEVDNAIDNIQTDPEEIEENLNEKLEKSKDDSEESDDEIKYESDLTPNELIEEIEFEYGEKLAKLLDKYKKKEITYAEYLALSKELESERRTELSKRLMNKLLGKIDKTEKKLDDTVANTVNKSVAESEANSNKHFGIIHKSLAKTGRVLGEVLFGLKANSSVNRGIAGMLNGLTGKVNAIVSKFSQSSLTEMLLTGLILIIGPIIGKLANFIDNLFGFKDKLAESRRQKGPYYSPSSSTTLQNLEKSRINSQSSAVEEFEKYQAPTNDAGYRRDLYEERDKLLKKDRPRTAIEYYKSPDGTKYFKNEYWVYNDNSVRLISSKAISKEDYESGMKKHATRSWRNFWRTTNLDKDRSNPREIEEINFTDDSNTLFNKTKEGLVKNLNNSIINDLSSPVGDPSKISDDRSFGNTSYRGRPHMGVDIPQPNGTPILAPTNDAGYRRVVYEERDKLLKKDRPRTAIEYYKSPDGTKYFKNEYWVYNDNSVRLISSKAISKEDYESGMKKHATRSWRNFWRTTNLDKDRSNPREIEEINFTDDSNTLFNKTKEGLVKNLNNSIINDLSSPVGDPSKISDDRSFGNTSYRGRPHMGVDIPQPNGTPILAPIDGVVSRVVYDLDGNKAGRRIELDHLDGKIRTRYFHLSKLPKGIKLGDQIKKGQIIGYVGGSGQSEESYGNHLHYEVMKYNKSKGDFINIDPADLKNQLADVKLVDTEPEMTPVDEIKPDVKANVSGSSDKTDDFNNTVEKSASTTEDILAEIRVNKSNVPNKSPEINLPSVTSNNINVKPNVEVNMDPATIKPELK